MEKKPAAAQSPVMDVRPAPPPDAIDPPSSAEPAKPADKTPAKPKPQQPVVPKKPRNGVGLAITATVIIVLGLAALATYAYLQAR